MRIIISDSSCLIDLHKGGLLQAVFSLPFQFVIPQPLFKEELLSIPQEEKDAMVALGMQVIVLPGEQVSQAQTYFNENRRLKLNDCFALVLAEETDEAILFTGDNPLRRLADSKDIETHGILWGIDMIEEHSDIPPEALLEALLKFRDDPLVWLPEDELKSRIRKLKRICR
jgi:predicted nucleic acid-binding protein